MKDSENVASGNTLKLPAIGIEGRALARDTPPSPEKDTESALDRKSGFSTLLIVVQLESDETD